MRTADGRVSKSESRPPMLFHRAASYRPKNVFYRHEPSEDERDLPSKFDGLTERGAEILYEYNYLRGAPTARALYENTRKSGIVERRQRAPDRNSPGPFEKR